MPRRNCLKDENRKFESSFIPARVGQRVVEVASRTGRSLLVDCPDTSRVETDGTPRCLAICNSESHFQVGRNILSRYPERSRPNRDTLLRRLLNLTTRDQHFPRLSGHGQSRQSEGGPVVTRTGASSKVSVVEVNFGNITRRN